jgi:gluconokinase
MIVLVMGVSGSGKSTLAARLAGALDGTFVEGDALHPAENVAAMARGRPLDDAMRAPWLEAVARRAVELARTGTVVIACSALRRAYRDLLRSRLGPITLVHLDAMRGTLEDRLAARQGHFMPASLLDSQLATLEPPDADEDCITIRAEQPTDEQLRIALDHLAARITAPTFLSEAGSAKPRAKG